MVNDSCLRGHHSFLRMEEDTPFVIANHSSLEHKQGKQCQVQVERTKNLEGRKKMHQKKHGSHMKTTTAELISSRAQMQRGKPSDSNWLLPSENRTTRKHYSVHSALLFSALFTGIHKKTWFSSYQNPACLTKHFASEKPKSTQRRVLSTVHSVPVCCLFGFTSKRCTCNSQTRRRFPAMFYFCFCRCFLYVSTHPKHHHGEPGILSMCAFVLFTSLVCDSLTIAFASAAISRSRHTLREHELMKNMSDKIHGYQSS